MNIPIYQIDAFTGRVFGGNPAAVCPLEKWLPAATMQAIAAENNLSETAFFVEKGDAFEIRWFTPAIEVDLCGHATLAAAHVIFNHINYFRPHIIFFSAGGRLQVEKREDLLMLDFPARDPELVEAPLLLTTALGRTPREVFKGRDFMAVFDTEADVAEISPDFAALARLDCLGVIVTAKGDACDFVSRFFAPRAGIPEDPVTGSAHTELIPFWAGRLKRSVLHAFQVSRRGGELFCEYRGNRVGIGGKAVTFLQGEINIPVD